MKRPCQNCGRPKGEHVGVTGNAAHRIVCPSSVYAPMPWPTHSWRTVTKPWAWGGVGTPVTLCAFCGCTKRAAEKLDLPCYPRATRTPTDSENEPEEPTDG